MNSDKPNQWLLIKLAIVFLTRWPVKITQEVDDKMLNAATGYFALVGLIVASVSATVFYTAHIFVVDTVAVVLAMMASVIFTGAFHEDGLADTADGLGGGWTVEAKLNIMKDSRIGTYGASALLLSLLLKFQLLLALADISHYAVIGALILAHSISRAMATSVIGRLDYVQLDQASKTKPVAKHLGAQSQSRLVITSAIVFVVSAYWLTILQVIALIALLFVIRAGLIAGIKRQLGGYTGDVLGAFQQVFELVIYLALLSFLG